MSPTMLLLSGSRGQSSNSTGRKCAKIWITINCLIPLKNAVSNCKKKLIRQTKSWSNRERRCIMSSTIYNTLTRKKEVFQPREEDKVKMYVCGPTVYNYIHIGNARPAVVFDTVRRYFEYKGYDVDYVLNFTDVDDKIIK